MLGGAATTVDVEVARIGGDGSVFASRKQFLPLEFTDFVEMQQELAEEEHQLAVTESYEVEVLGLDCQALACKRVRPGSKESATGYVIEVSRTDSLKPQLERARPIEEGLKNTRERAALAQKAASNALKAQEDRLVAYIAEIDEALRSSKAATAAASQVKEVPAAPRAPVGGKPAPPTTEPKAKGTPPDREKPKGGKLDSKKQSSRGRTKRK